MPKYLLECTVKTLAYFPKMWRFVKPELKSAKTMQI